MDSSLKFNTDVLIALDRPYNEKVTFNQIINVLKNQRSDISRRMALNHNCFLSQEEMPFSWHFNDRDNNYVRVLSFPMVKKSTGWKFIMDFQDDGKIYLSEGKGTLRTEISLSKLNSLRWTVRKAIAEILEKLCSKYQEPGIRAFRRQRLFEIATIITDGKAEKLWEAVLNNQKGSVFMLSALGQTQLFRNKLSDPSYEKHIYFVSKVEPYDCKEYGETDEEVKAIRRVTCITTNSCQNEDTVVNGGGGTCYMNYDQDGKLICVEFVNEDMEETVKQKICNELKKAAIPDDSLDMFYDPQGQEIYHAWSDVPEDHRPRFFMYDAEADVRASFIEHPAIGIEGWEANYYFDDVKEILLNRSELFKDSEKSVFFWHHHVLDNPPYIF